MLAYFWPADDQNYAHNFHFQSAISCQLLFYISRLNGVPSRSTCMFCTKRSSGMWSYDMVTFIIFFSFLIFAQNQQMVALFLEGNVNILVFWQILSSDFWRELHNFLSTRRFFAFCQLEDFLSRWGNRIFLIRRRSELCSQLSFSESHQLSASYLHIPAKHCPQRIHRPRRGHRTRSLPKRSRSPVAASRVKANRHSYS